MNSPDNQSPGDLDDRLWQLLNAVCNQSLADDEATELAERLANDDAAQLAYLDVCRFHVDLYLLLGASRAMDCVRNLTGVFEQDAVAADVAFMDRESSAAIPLADTVDWSPPLETLRGGYLNSVAAMLRRPVVWTTLACGLAFVIYFTLISWGILSKELPTPPVASAPPNASSLANSKPPRASQPVAMLASAAECQWQVPAEATAPTSGSKFTVNQKLQLNSGKAAFAFWGGVTVLIEGPAKFEMVSATQAKLERGKLVAHVPPAAIGFTVETPTGKVVDLGTEFGVEVNEQGGTAAEVFTGKVEVVADGNATIIDTPTPQPNQPHKAAEGQPIVLTAGQSARLERGKIPTLGGPVDSLSALHQHLRSTVTTASPGVVMQDIDLVQDDAADWHNPDVWSNGQAPHAYGHYHVGRQDATRLRTPAEHQPEAFEGGALTIHTAGRFIPKHQGITRVRDLRLNGGRIALPVSLRRHADVTLGGVFTVQAPAQIFLNDCDLTLAIKLLGEKGLRIKGPGTLYLKSDGEHFAGNWRVTNAQLVAVAYGSLGSGSVEVTNGGRLELQYDINSPRATVSLTNGGQLTVNRNYVFGGVTIDGQPLPAGKYTAAQLKELYPDNFGGEKGTLTVVGEHCHGGIRGIEVRA